LKPSEGWIPFCGGRQQSHLSSGEIRGDLDLFGVVVGKGGMNLPLSDLANVDPGPETGGRSLAAEA